MTSNAKLLIYYHSLAPSGGVERVISNLSHALLDHMDIKIVTKDPKEPFYKMPSNVTIDNLKINYQRDMDNRLKRFFQVLFELPKTIIRLRKYLKNTEFDKVYVGSPQGAFEAWIALGFDGSKIIVAEHSAFNSYNKIYEAMKRLVYPKVFKIVSPTKFDAKIYSERNYPVDYVPHLSTFEAHQMDLNLKQNVVLNVGRLTNDKQQIILLQIWKEIMKLPELSHWKLKIIGSGELRNEINNFIEANDLSKNAELIDHTSNIEKYYEEASIFALTSKTEGFGMVLLEAMSFSCACVAFDCDSGPRDIITNGSNGVLVEIGNLKSYKQELIDIMENTERRHNIQLSSQDFVEKWPNEEIVSKWISLVRG